MDLSNPYILTLAISLGIQAFFFAFAARLKTDKVTDLSYGLTFIILATYWLFRGSESVGLFEVVLASMITIWGLRIAGYLLVRIIKTGRDRRFDEMRDKPLKFARFWFLQGISVWVIMIPAIYLLTRDVTAEMDIFASLGVTIWLIGIVVETYADAQLFSFRFKKDNKGKWIDEGLWHYSRHPNYFGELLVWWGLFIYGASVYQGIGWLVIIGPLIITFLLLFVTGIPILEKNNDLRWSKNKEYLRYKKSTSLLIPLPKR